MSVLITTTWTSQHQVGGHCENIMTIRMGGDNTPDQCRNVDNLTPCILYKDFSGLRGGYEVERIGGFGDLDSNNVSSIEHVVHRCLWCAISNRHDWQNIIIETRLLLMWLWLVYCFWCILVATPVHCGPGMVLSLRWHATWRMHPRWGWE